VGDGSYDTDSGILLIRGGSVDGSLRPTGGIPRFAVEGDEVIELELVEIDGPRPPQHAMPL
jgi:hypothetical protein